MLKTKPRTKPARSQPARVPQEVLTLAEAASYLRLPEADVARLVEEQNLPGRRVGNEWRFLLVGLRTWLLAAPGPKSNKEAWDALVGVWKDDPNFDVFLREINKERNRDKDDNQA